MDRIVNVLDITYVELILVDRARRTFGADADKNGIVNPRDIVRIEQIIMEQP